MALTKLNLIKRKYNDKREKLKKEYLKRTGKKIAIGFKETKEYKQNERNKKRAIDRYYARKKREINILKSKPKKRDEPTPEQLAEDDNEPEENERDGQEDWRDEVRAGRTDPRTAFDNFTVILFREVYWNVFYFGGDANSAASEMFSIHDGDDFAFAEIDATETGHGITIHKDQGSFDRRSMELYRMLTNDTRDTKKRGTKRGKKYEEVKIYYLVDAVSYTRNGRDYLDIYIYID